MTINCAERGLLLLRARDEIRMTIAAYQTLYESSIAFGMRKALMAEHKRNQSEFQLKELKLEKQELERQVLELDERCEHVMIREQERCANDERKHKEETDYLRKTNQTLKANLEQMLSTPKA